jgi:O-antigen/teichoic acid export membrane protein
MIRQALHRLTKIDATRPLMLRAAVVGLNFCVMMWLSFALGLSAFGALIYLWGGALVASTLVSCGGPLILLRALSNGTGLRVVHMVGLIAVLPAVLSVTGWFLATMFLPRIDWATLFAVAFSVNMLGCLASVMRAIGSVQISMFLRDAGPFSALGIASFLAADAGPAALLLVTAIVICAMSIAATIWCITHRRNLAKPNGKPISWWSWPLWGTSILGMGLAQVDLIIGGTLMSAEALGLYALLRRIANVVALPVSVATWVSAKPVAAAHGAGDHSALKDASARASRIAWYPALGLAALCRGGLVIAAVSPWPLVTAQIAVCFGILMFGALMQAFLASGFTVATLSNHAALSVTARTVTILSYLCFAVLIGNQMTPVHNALGYTVAMCIGSGLVWVVILRNLGIDTSARVLWHREVRMWKIS